MKKRRLLSKFTFIKQGNVDMDGRFIFSSQFYISTLPSKVILLLRAIRKKAVLSLSKLNFIMFQMLPIRSLMILTWNLCRSFLLVIRLENCHWKWELMDLKSSRKKKRRVVHALTTCPGGMLLENSISYLMLPSILVTKWLMLVNLSSVKKLRLIL